MLTFIAIDFCDSTRFKSRKVSVWRHGAQAYHNHHKTKYQDHHREDLWYWRLVQKAEPKAEHFSTSRTSSHARLGRWEDGDCSRTEPLVETRLGALAFKFMCSCPCQEVCQFALVEGPFGLPEHPAHIPPRPCAGAWGSVLALPALHSPLYLAPDQPLLLG